MNQFAIKLDDSLNAILVKELRQTVRGKFFWSVFNLFLGIMVVILAVSLSENVHGNGGNVISILFSILYFACFFLVPLYVGKKVNNEKKDGMDELISITTMSPKSIVMGKFLCGFAIITMLYCAFLPFMSLTVFMGGIDTHELIIATLLSYSLCMLAVLFQIGIGFEASAVSGLGIGVKIFGVVLQLSFFSSTIAYCLSCLSGKGIDSYLNLLACLFGEFIIGVIMFVTSVSFLKPDTANKSYFIRKLSTGLWAVCIALLFVRPAWIEEIYVVLTILLFFTSIFYVREQEYYSDRIVCEIPKNPVKRLLKFPLFTGMANGFSWVALTTIISAIILVIIAHGSAVKTSKSYGEFGIFLFSIIATVNAFGLLGNSLRKRFYKNFPRATNILIGFIIHFVTGWLPTLIASILSSHDRDYREIIMWINPMLAMFEDKIDIAASGASLILLIGITLNARSLFRQVKQYFYMASYENEENKF